MPTERDKLVADNLSMVQAIAGKLKRTLGKAMDFDDLVGYGHKGLIEAADRFDSTQGVTFSTFAYYRIRGAMLDGMRAMGWYSRSDYARYRAEERAHEYMRNAAEREEGAVDESAEARAGKAETLENIGEILSAVATVHITSMEAAVNVADDKYGAPDADLELGQLALRVKEEIANLPEKERRLMQMYYFEEKKLEDAGAALGLSKSWASRLHARAVNMLRDALQKHL